MIVTKQSGWGKAIPWANLCWGIWAGTLGVAFYFGSVIESADAQNARIRVITAPIDAKLGSIAAQVSEIKVSVNQHVDRPGHPQVVTRMSAVEDDIGEIKRDVKEILRHLNTPR